MLNEEETVPETGELELDIKIPSPIIKENLAFRDDIRKNTRRGREAYYIPYDKIFIRDDHNAKKSYDPQYLEDLADSIIDIGLQEPITVVMYKDGTAVVITGHCRRLAFDIINKRGLKGFNEIECVIAAKNLSEIDYTVLMLLENIKHATDPMDEAQAILRLKQSGLSNAAIAKKLPGMNEMQIGNRLTLAGLSPQVQELIASGRISPTAAVKLARAHPDPDKQVEVIQAAASSEEGKLKVKNVEPESNFIARAADGSQDDEDGPFGGPGDEPDKFKKDRDEYDSITSGSKDDPSMKGTSPKANESTQDPAIKSKDQPKMDDASITSGKGTAYDLTCQAITKFKALDDDMGVEKTPKQDTLIYEIDKLLYDIRAILKK